VLRSSRCDCHFCSSSSRVQLGIAREHVGSSALRASSCPAARLAVVTHFDAKDLHVSVARGERALERSSVRCSDR